MLWILDNSKFKNNNNNNYNNNNNKQTTNYTDYK